MLVGTLKAPGKLVVLIGVDEVACFTCQNQTACVSCSPGFSLQNGACVVVGPCPNGLVRNDNNCVAICPLGFYNKEGYCVRTCPSDTFLWNGRCYSTCPTGLSTVSACVIVCPADTVKDGSKCVALVLNCSSSQFLNSAIGACAICQFPCSSC